MKILNLLKLKTEQRQILFLQDNLKTYGLSPEDWIIKHIEGNVYKIEHIRSPDFSFKGITSTNSNGRQWKRIYLKSI